jgi:hypothetical protein
MPVRAFDRTVLVYDARVIARRIHAVVPHQLLMAIGQVLSCTRCQIRMSVLSSARFMALLSVAEADAIQAVSEAKYHYQF